MNKFLTLATAGVLAAGSLSAQAQVTVDGQLTAAEVTAGNYVLLGKFTNPRGFGNAGLLSLYAATTPTKMYVFVGGTVEANGNAFQLFLDLPGVAGVPVGTALPAGGSGTSFEKFTAKLDLAADLALALRSEGTGYQVEGVSYTSAPATTTTKLTTTSGQLLADGTALTLPTTTATGNYARLAGARVAYKVAATAGISGNPGNTATTSTTTPPVTTYPASYGGVGSYGWEIELDRTNAGLTAANAAVTMFVLQNSGNGDYPSSDFIPQAPTPLTTNSGNLASGSFDFTTLAGRQAATVTLGANGVLGSKSADAAAIALGLYPNPTQGSATVSFNVGSRAENVGITLTDLLGREVRVLANGLQAAGTQTKAVDLTNVAAGTYLLRVQVGEKVSTSKVVLM